MENEKKPRKPLDNKTIKEKLKVLHVQEDGFNKEMGAINTEINKLQTRKDKLANMISKNMKNRNKLINMLTAEEIQDFINNIK